MYFSNSGATKDLVSPDSSESALESASDAGTGTNGSDTSGGTSDTPQNELSKLRIFVTNQEWAPYYLGGISGANDKCQEAADKAVLGGTWLALISSDAQDAKDLVSPGMPIVRLDGIQVADDKADMFDYTIDNEIRVNELLNFEKGEVWTGTFANGLATDIDCQDWTILLKYGTVGKVGGTYTDLRWMYDSKKDCEMDAHLYCIEVFG